MFERLKNHCETTKHKCWVSYYCMKLCWKLFKRSIVHDLSKYGKEEADVFAKNVHKLSGVTYGSKEYKQLLKNIEPALEHHYENNSHHPEFYVEGFKDMSGLDRIEMAIDWLAATRRHDDGDIFKSIEINQERFDYLESDKIWLKKIIEDLI